MYKLDKLYYQYFPEGIDEWCKENEATIVEIDDELFIKMKGEDDGEH
ncbi:MAG: hypothetical protein MJZ20_02745 [Bacteroidaceae bacterium]|nr:hypothetical protein [Bacteroidaceae bacterium]